MLATQARRQVQNPQPPSLSANTSQSISTNDPDVMSLSDIGLRNLLHSMSGNHLVPPPVFSSEASENNEAFSFPDFFNLADDNLPAVDATLKQDPRQEGSALIAAALLERLEQVAAINSDDDVEGYEGEEDVSSPSESEREDDNASTSYDELPELPRKRARTSDKQAFTAEWYPWSDRITCTLDILMHLPRSVFSQRQLDLFLWLLRVNGMSDVPSVKTMKSLNEALQKMCGIDTLAYDGALGNRYYVNSIAQIIAQEMSNPLIRPKLHFYPEDSGKHLSQAHQAQRWLNEAPDQLLTPMARINQRDFYIYEPAMLMNGTCCIPIRWFSRKNSLYARCWSMTPVISDDNAHSGWEVIKAEFEIAASQFLKNFVELKIDAGPLYGLPHPSQLLVVKSADRQTSTLWTYTNSAEGNRWRNIAGGHRVVSFPIWLYCDDTSGNVSKKWNEHNSFLFTPAGLPRTDSSKEYNIHFLCTSNTARPLEMLDGIIDQLEVAQEHGIWAWDCETKEPILVLPWVLAMLGDNPMQSEFAGHIGLRGKFFCRVCWVKGVDAKDHNHGEDGHDRAEDAERRPESSDRSDTEQSYSESSANESDMLPKQTGKKPKQSKKFTESFSQMVERVSSFVKAGKPREKSETITQLRSYFIDAQMLGTKTKIKAAHTSSGVKDTFQEHFLDRLFNSYSKKRTTATRQAALDQEIRNLPEEITSPVWRIKGLDPHQDTPVEILHVVLLGFLKYMWRDLVNQVKNQDELKELLETRLLSLDVTGLDISPIAGRTLVQYAGSLTGRDFRVIAQITPFIIHDLKISDSCREAWLALSRLVPLIWQPEIDDIDEYIKNLEHAVDTFLLSVARWTTRWFNKPKFHILIHLALHIRRFGPAMLFATEAFESFNAIIRAKSVHSNRQAPSRDIALAFAQGNRIRHLLSQGLFFLHQDSILPSSLPSGSGTVQTYTSLHSSGKSTIKPSPRLFTADSTKWKTIGPGPVSLLSSQNTVVHYLGLEQKKPNKQGGSVSLSRTGPHAFKDTLTGMILPTCTAYPENVRNSGQFRKCSSVVMSDGLACPVDSFFIGRNSQGVCFIGQLVEVLVAQKSAAALDQQAGSIYGIGSGTPPLTRTDLATKLYMLASSYAFEEEFIRRDNSRIQGNGDLQEILKDPQRHLGNLKEPQKPKPPKITLKVLKIWGVSLNALGMKYFFLMKIRLEDKFDVTAEQRVTIRCTAQDMIFQKDRTSFCQLFVEVMAVLRRDKAALKMTNIFDLPGREKRLQSVVKKVTSSVRNAYRQDIRDSITGTEVKSLKAFTFDAAVKYKRGGPGEKADPVLAIHNAILRRLAFENKGLLGIEEPETEDNAESEEGPRRKKQRTSGNGGRIAKVNHFWGRVDLFFEKEIATRGADLNGAGWKSYIEETVKWDTTMFRDDDGSDEGPSTSAQSALLDVQSTPGFAAAQSIVPGAQGAALFT
ncbi:hypothetical protein EV361DRAFT_965326 [Lentinula raphanica]|nr:hypothetical protein EV361DRAFT_965326 [Lentinula raphanica]